MNSIISRVLGRLKRDIRSSVTKLRHHVFPLWFASSLTRRIYFRIYNAAGYKYKESIQTDYFEKASLRWIPRSFNFPVLFNEKIVSIPVRRESFKSDLGLAFCLLGLDAPVKNLYGLIFSNGASEGIRVIDVGANLGQNLFLFLSQTPRVVAYEPNPTCQQTLHHITEINGYSPSIVSAAVGPNSSSITLRWPPGQTWYGTVASTDHLVEIGCSEFEEVIVPQVTLDKEIGPITKQRILIKIDVEGYEYGVLQGASSLLAANDCIIVFEHDVNRVDGRRRIWENLTGLGYSIYSIELASERPLQHCKNERDYLADGMPNHCAIKSNSVFSFLVNK
jgi:FkbM family methyltransferase